MGRCRILTDLAHGSFNLGGLPKSIKRRQLPCPFRGTSSPHPKPSRLCPSTISGSPASRSALPSPSVEGNPMRLTPSRVFVWLVLVAFCTMTASRCRADSDLSTAKLGKQIDNVIFKDGSGKPLALHDLKDRKAVVVVFLSFDCPVSTSYSETLTLLSKTYADRGVTFLGVSVNPEDDAAQLARHVKDFAIPFPVFKDEKGAAADAFKAEVTPEAFVLDHHFILRYRGRIDNAYAARLKKNLNVTSHDLRKALDELLAGKPVSEPATEPVGCSIPK